MNIHYLYSSDDKSPKDGEVPSEDFGTQTVTNSVTGPSNTTGASILVPTIPGYTASVDQVTPDFAIKADGSENGQLITPDINVTYTKMPRLPIKLPVLMLLVRWIQVI